MSLLEKHAGSSSSFETDSRDRHLQAKLRTLRVLDAARAGATALALLMGVAVLGIAGNSLRVYNRSRAGAADWLSLWPSGAALDVKPTVALLVGAALVVLANAVALSSHQRAVRATLARARVHTPLTFTAPFVGLVAAVVAVALFYVADRSATADTLLSWSCRWRRLDTAGPAPRFASLCHASRAAVDLAILLVPVEFLAFSLAGWQLKVDRYTAAYANARRTPSPVQ